MHFEITGTKVLYWGVYFLYIFVQPPEYLMYEIQKISKFQTNFANVEDLLHKPKIWCYFLFLFLVLGGKFLSK